MTKSKATASEMPASITLAAPHGFIDEDGSHKMWAAGRVVDDPEEIALLLSRGALIEETPVDAERLAPASDA